MGTAFYFVGYPWLIVLSLSIIAGFLTCIVFMIASDMIFRRLNFKDAFKRSYHMSIVSILIMVGMENVIILLVMPKLQSHEMPMNAQHGFGVMLLAMSLGFFLSLPYNYYHLQKFGKTCHV